MESAFSRVRRCWIVAVCLVVSRVSAQTVLITAPTTINPGQTTVTPTGGGVPVPLGTADIVVRGAVLTVNGDHTIRSLVVERNASNAPGVVTHADAFATGLIEGMRLAVTQDVRIQGANGALVASRIDVSSRGYNWQVNGTESGPGSGNLANCYPGSGGGYGGLGGRGSCDHRRGPAYGSAFLPLHRGSAGSSRGGNGGGVCVLRVAGLLQLDGSVTANGQNTPGGFTDGGGSGGSILIMATTLAGNGVVSADGGNGNVPAGGGAGGRIAIYACDRTAFAPSRVSVSGGTGFQVGDPGTVYLHSQPAVFKHQDTARAASLGTRRDGQVHCRSIRPWPVRLPVAEGWCTVGRGRAILGNHGADPVDRRCGEWRCRDVRLCRLVGDVRVGDDGSRGHVGACC